MKVWLYWGLKQNGDDTLLTVYTHQPTFNETHEVSSRNPFYDYELTERETMPGPREHNEALYDKLKKLLPPEPEDKTAVWSSKINFKPDTIRYGSDAFFSCLGGELPRNDRELLDILYVFGKFMFKEMERQADYWRKVTTDFMNVSANQKIYQGIMKSSLDILQGPPKEDVCLTPKK